jgi:hypothetical protein
MESGLERSIDNLLLRAGVSREQISEARDKSAEDGEFGRHVEAVAGLSQLRFAALLAEKMR